MAKVFDENGNELEGYFSGDEVQTQVSTAIAAKESEFGKTKAEIEKERDEARNALSERSSEFVKFRKLSDEQVKQLSEKDLIIYQNGIALNEEREKSATAEKARIEAQVDAAIRGKAGNDEKLFTKMKDMWSVIGIEATTPETIENKTKMILGALGSTEPDLVASVAGFSNGSYAPPSPKKEGEKSFADTEEGKQAAKDFGLVLEVPKQ